MTQMPSFDYRGLKCPLPVLKARRALAQLGNGEVVEFLADDPASPLDMAHFCEAEGHRLARSDAVEFYFIYHIIKGASD
jgi:tRNA 2-thiouridine synthesizing protein A